MDKVIERSIELAGRRLTLSTGRLARLTDASVEARYGDTVLLATVAKAPPREDLDYFPLSVEFEERLYAGGRISSSRFVKREGRPTENAVLSGRIVDRSIRPLFPKDYSGEVQVIITVLSVDQDNDPASLAVIAASAALSISTIAWNGPVASVRVGEKDGVYIINPANGEAEFSDLDLLVCANKDAVVMIEAAADQVGEPVAFGAIKEGFVAAQAVIGLIEEFKKEASKEKESYEVAGIDEEKKTKIEKFIEKNIISTLSDPKEASDETWEERSLKTLDGEFAESLEVGKKELKTLLEKSFHAFVRSKILDEGVRLDGRKTDEVRPLTIDVGLLPRTHGSALFRRGETQVLSIATLGSPALQQLIEGMGGEATKRYMHHYNFPPYSTGEVRRVGSPGRREIGHGALAEKALAPVIPSEDVFPYAIRVVSEVMSSSGSTSMASVCGSTLALMDAGVPINEPVAGVAMGLVTDESRQVILTDIAYSEDANGDMDFKVAGTKSGITAIQMDVKISGISFEIIEKTLSQARDGRLFILDKMLAVLPKTREQLSPYAPRVETIHVEPEKIGTIIGGGGKTINNIIAQTGAAIDIEDDGTVTVSGKDPESIKKALEWIEGLTKEVKAGEVYEGVVKRILNFGAFVEILPGKEGLVHISQLAPHRVEKVEDIVSVGQKVKVRVVEIDEQHRVNLSMLFGQDAQAKERERRDRPERDRPFDRRRERR